MSRLQDLDSLSVILGSCIVLFISLVWYFVSFQAHVYGDAGSAEDQKQHHHKHHAGRLSGRPKDSRGIPLTHQEQVIKPHLVSSIGTIQSASHQHPR